MSGKVAGLSGSPANAAFAFAGVTFSTVMIVPDTLTLKLQEFNPETRSAYLAVMSGISAGAGALGLARPIDRRHAAVWRVTSEVQ